MNIYGGAGNDVITLAASADPNTVDGGAGDDTLTGGAARDVIAGGSGNDRITGGGAGDALDGGAGLDTAVLAGSHDTYAVVRSLDRSWISVWIPMAYIPENPSAPYGDMDHLVGIERLEFGDRKLAFDLGAGEAAANTVRIIGAAFGDDAIAQHPDWVRDGLSWFDGGLSMLEVCERVFDTPAYRELYGPQTDRDFVTAVYRNATGGYPAPEVQTSYESLLSGDGAAMTRAELLMFAAASDDNARHIDLAGLQRTGVDFF